MANLNITNTFVANTTAQASQVNQNFTDIKTWLNNRDNASDYWLNMKVLASVSNPAEIKSTATDCEFDIDCTGTNGTPRISWKRSGMTYFTMGVDGAASNLLKFGTSALTTNVAMQIPTTGSQVQFADGTVAAPGISFLNNTGTGLYRIGSNDFAVATNGTLALEFTSGQDVYTGIFQDYGATSTITGWAAFTTKSIYYKKIGKLVWVWFTLDGTSNATTSNFTLPFPVANNVDIWGSFKLRDNNVDQAAAGAIEIDKNTSLVNLYKDFTAAVGWTSSNRKICQGEFFYQTT
jgi:hypothetical protein